MGIHQLEPRFTRLVQAALGSRATVTRFGDHWQLKDRTGGTQLFRTVEELCAAVQLVKPHDEITAESGSTTVGAAAAGLTEIRGYPLSDLPDSWDAHTLFQWLRIEASG